MPWTVLVLPEVDEDLATLERARRGVGAMLLGSVKASFHEEFRSRRIDDALHGAARTDQIVRLEGSHYPFSFRLQVHHDYRATCLLMPVPRLAIVMHVFAKSRDPKYWNALRIHERRLVPIIRAFKAYVDEAGP